MSRMRAEIFEQPTALKGLNPDHPRTLSKVTQSM